MHAVVDLELNVMWFLNVGDENSKYFHGILNKKISQLVIRGILVDGEWLDDPSKVKSEFLKHFANRFSEPVSSPIRLDYNFPNCLSFEQAEDLERGVTYDEIKRAV